MIHGEVEAIVPNLFELIFILEMMLGNLQVPADCFLVVSPMLPLFGALEDLISRLLARLRSSRIVFVDLVDKVWCVLICNSQCLTVHLSLLVHVDSLLWLFCVDKALFSLAEVTTVQLESGLVQKDFVH
jgi:hypothetical protein